MDDTQIMKIALKEAYKAYKIEEVPVGAVVVNHDNNGRVQIIAKAYNKRESKKSPSAHAEFLAIEKAAKKLDRWRLNDCTVYVTLEPCIMCAGLMHQARIKKCVFGAYDQKAGALKTLYKINEDIRLNHNFEVEGGILKDECANILSDFFKKRR